MLEGAEEGLESQSTESTESTENLEGASGSPQEQPKPAEPLDLDSVEKFRLEGREWTPKDFKGAYMMQSDYTRKTQELAEERKYYDNLNYDLAKIKNNPSLIEDFKKVYPEKFHSFLDYVQGAQPQASGQNPQNPGNSPQGMDPKVLERINRIESEFHERKVEAISAQLDATFSKLSKTYPMADEEAVLARAQSMIDKGEKLTDKVWDSLWKSVHDRNETLAKKFYSQKVNNQKQASAKGKDVPSGGGIPGKAPQQHRTIKEAHEAYLAQLE